MKRVIKIGFPIVCVAIIGGTFFLLNRTLDKVNDSSIDENSINESTNEIQNTITTSIEEDTENMNTVTSTISLEEEEAKEAKEIENKAKALEIVEIKDGERNQKVYYTNEGMDEDKYIVAVRNEETTEAIIFYAVDVENEEVEIYY